MLDDVGMIVPISDEVTVVDADVAITDVVSADAVEAEPY